jgi:lambda repressor-like predicted transcriptional regulator
LTGRRGQPPKIEADRYPELLDLLHAGLSMPAAARKMGVARSTLYNLADRDEVMGEKIRAARTAAKAARAAAHEPSEGCYVNNGCRRPECTAAATEARARRRAARPVSVYELLTPDPDRLADSA